MGVGDCARLCAGAEKGQLYYRSRDLEEGHKRSRILNSGVDVATLYARIPLLLTPSQDFILWRRSPRGPGRYRR